MTWALDVGKHKCQRVERPGRIRRLWECRLRVWWPGEEADEKRKGEGERQEEDKGHYPMSLVLHAVCALLLTLMVLAVGALIAYLRYYHENDWRDMLHNLFCGCRFPDECRGRRHRRWGRGGHGDEDEGDEEQDLERGRASAALSPSACQMDTIELVDETQPAAATTVAAGTELSVGQQTLPPEWLGAVQCAVQTAVQVAVQVSAHHPSSPLPSPAT
ncbi:protein UL136 [Panine betaherpesvirus 2]|uniref:Protein UL136 n=1 Tax=Panine betaherpesvirus 2 TaxID=188763 RepID=Q8QRW8_9BETA|nr:protein UL136 [Panine betaherpesvirus 2]AAM00771.1 protein UL136 [Panine betaherpesvirus 2]QXV67884.1 protein UL136 [Panine betaherpesvirus 2]